MERGRDRADGGFDAMIAVGDFSQVRERGHQANCAVYAHAEISDIIEENYAGSTGGIGWLAEKSAHDNSRAARFIGQRAAEIIVIEAKAFHLLGHGSPAEVRTTADYNSSGLAARVRVHDVDTFDGVEQIREGFLNSRFGKTHAQAIRPLRERRAYNIHQG